MGERKTMHRFSLLCSGLRSDVVNGVGAGEYLVSVSVGDLDGKLFLEGHDDLHGVQAVKSQVVLEVRTRSHLLQPHEKAFVLNMQGIVLPYDQNHKISRTSN